MIIFSSSFKLNEIQLVDSPFKEDPRNIIFSQEGPNFGRNETQKRKKLEQSNFAQL